MTEPVDRRTSADDLAARAYEHTPEAAKPRFQGTQALPITNPNVQPTPVPAAAVQPAVARFADPKNHDNPANFVLRTVGNAWTNVPDNDLRNYIQSVTITPLTDMRMVTLADGSKVVGGRLTCTVVFDNPRGPPHTITTTETLDFETGIKWPETAAERADAATKMHLNASCYAHFYECLTDPTKGRPPEIWGKINQILHDSVLRIKPTSPGKIDGAKIEWDKHTVLVYTAAKVNALRYKIGGQLGPDVSLAAAAKHKLPVVSNAVSALIAPPRIVGHEHQEAMRKLAAGELGTVNPMVVRRAAKGLEPQEYMKHLTDEIDTLQNAADHIIEQVIERDVYGAPHPTSALMEYHTRLAGLRATQAELEGIRRGTPISPRPLNIVQQENNEHLAELQKNPQFLSALPDLVALNDAIDFRRRQFADLVDPKLSTPADLALQGQPPVPPSAEQIKSWQDKNIAIQTGYNKNKDVIDFLGSKKLGPASGTDTEKRAALVGEIDDLTQQSIAVRTTLGNGAIARQAAREHVATLQQQISINIKPQANFPGAKMLIEHRSYTSAFEAHGNGLVVVEQGNRNLQGIQAELVQRKKLLDTQIASIGPAQAGIEGLTVLQNTLNTHLAHIKNALSAAAKELHGDLRPEHNRLKKLIEDALPTPPNVPTPPQTPARGRLGSSIDDSLVLPQPHSASIPGRGLIPLPSATDNLSPSTVAQKNARRSRVRARTVAGSIPPVKPVASSSSSPPPPDKASSPKRKPTLDEELDYTEIGKRAGEKALSSGPRQTSSLSSAFPPPSRLRSDSSDSSASDSSEDSFYWDSASGTLREREAPSSVDAPAESLDDSTPPVPGAPHPNAARKPSTPEKRDRVSSTSPRKSSLPAAKSKGGKQKKTRNRQPSQGIELENL